MDIQKDFLEMQIAYEKNCAIRCNCSYEELKAQLDNTESLFGTRYLEGSPRHENWLLWVQAWQAAQIQAMPDGFVLVEKSKVHTWYQDDESPENYCHSESDLDCLGDCLDDDDIITVNIHESAHISTRKVFGVWKSNSPTDIQSKFVLIDSRAEAEEIVTANKAMFKVQEQSHD